MKSKAILEDLTEYVNRGITPRYTEALENSLPVINQRCIRDFHVNMELVRLNDLSKRKVTEEKTLQKNDVLINSTGVGTLGRVAQFYGESGSATVDSHVTIVRPKAELVDPIYFGYLLKSKQRLIESFAAGTTGQTELARDSVKEMVLEYVSDIEKQKVIGNCFLVLDEKIQLNHQINQTLEQIAQALFKSWFVDFDPVKAKIDVLEAGGSEEEALLAAMQVISSKNAEELAAFEVEKPEEYAQLRATAELFPAAMVGSELGEIPRGWGVGCLGDLLHFNPRRTLKKGTVAPYLDMKNVPTSGHLADEIVEREMGSGTKFINGDTLLARITPCLENGKTAYVDFLEKDQVGWGSTEYIVIRPKSKYAESLGYFIARNEIFRNHAIQSMTGTSGRQRASAKVLEDLPWVIYPKEIIKFFDKVAGGYLKLAKIYGDESKQLAELRDTLLPKLLSGELDVSELADSLGAET